jgi:tetratricopeptide (TPR) repeat protein
MNVGRNDPCPCGSGKKSKHCCRGKSASTNPPTPTSSVAQHTQQFDALTRAARELFAAQRFPEASVLLKDVVRIRPKSADAHYDLAVAYIRCGHYLEAAESLRHALKLRPSFHEASVHLAEALEYLALNAEASSIYRRLSRSGADPQQKLYHAAKALMLEGQLREAETTLRRLLSIQPVNGRIRNLLGRVLVDQRRFQDAATELGLALQTYPAAFHGLASVQQMATSDRPLLERMRSKTEEAGLGAEDRTLILYGLGKAYDDLGDYAEAISCYDAANALRRKSARFDRAALARRYDDLITRYDAASLNHLSEDAERRPALTDGELPILIVGLPRSGTTLVEQILSSHTAVAAGGELQYWRIRSLETEQVLDSWRDASVLKNAADDYTKVLREIGPHALRVTDKAPLNFETLGLVISALPRCRIIHCRRQPIDTCLSIYFTEFSSSLGFAFDRGDIAYFYRQYCRLIAHWRHVLPPDRLLEIDYETLVADPEVVIRQLVEFAGLPWEEECLAPEQNERVVKTASLWQVRQPIYTTSVERWRHYEPWLGELMEFVPGHPL